MAGPELCLHTPPLTALGHGREGRLGRLASTTNNKCHSFEETKLSWLLAEEDCRMVVWGNLFLQS